MVQNTKKKERRISLFLGYDKGNNHFVDDAIYEFFNKIPNKANVIKSILYAYTINNNYVLEGNKIDVMERGMIDHIDKFTLKGMVYEHANVNENVTDNVESSVTENVTLNEQLSVTENVTPNVTESVTEKVTEQVTTEKEIDSDIEFEIKEVVKKDIDKNNNDFDINKFMDQIENLNYDDF